MEEKKDFSTKCSDETKREKTTTNNRITVPATETVKPRKRRKKKKAELPPEYSIIDKSVCEFVATVIPFSLLVISTGNKQYELSKEEVTILTPLWDRVITKRLPEYLSQYTEEVSLVSMICMLIVKKSDISTLISPQKE